jgi:hypothetical protein
VSFFPQFTAKFNKATLFFQVHHFPGKAKWQLENKTLVNKTLISNHTCHSPIPKI